MQVEFQFQGDLCVLRLQGRFATGRDAGYLHSKADELKNSGCTKILADFRDVEYIDSTGIGFLIGIYSSVMKNPAGGFAVANLNQRVREVLRLTRLDEVLPIYPDDAAALAALNSPKSSASRAR